MALSEKTTETHAILSGRRQAIDSLRSGQEPMWFRCAKFAKHEALRGLVRSLDNKPATVTNESSQLSNYAKELDYASAPHEPSSRYNDMTPPSMKVFARSGGNKIRAVRPGDIRSLGEMLATIGLDLKATVRAELRDAARCSPAKYDYPPDAEHHTLEPVIKQAELHAPAGGE